MTLESFRRAGAVLSGIGAGLIFTHMIHEATGIEGPGLRVLYLVLVGFGAAAGWSNSRDLAPWTDRDRRDWIIGWIVVLALIGIVLLTFAADAFK